ncbi:hypothetical protein K227x_63470 [Rubripirellula lacrimiformis]|uniref:Methyltransferase FkbM domain-containing protein n=1 Tax=Rubripirellula lacrimiformis TaxID=1930273 RepID=A0A517NLA3_9BACT|nr:hypothetical protein [Rubripirellula lacrimiformis]QDT07918.1 hypothetical protein K227x_63470 [Rubripirellula lacrimiformis]
MKKQLYSIARRVTRVLMKNDRLWELAQYLPAQNFFYHQRTPVIQKRAARECADLLQQCEVLAGPFTGMRYAKAASVGSMLWPKLLGTYESELRPCIESIAQKSQYRQIVDVGFAEGFYLVGLGRIFSDARLIGFDTEDEAKRQCHANAELNDIEPSRLSLFGGFDADTFRQNLDDDSLVVVDCEGFENDVVESVSPDERQKADWLIETHDHLVHGTTERMIHAFEDTHDVVEVTTDDGLQNKLELLPDFIRQRHNQYVQEALVSERRKTKQSWIIATRRAA